VIGTDLCDVLAGNASCMDWIKAQRRARIAGNASPFLL